MTLIFGGLRSRRSIEQLRQLQSHGLRSMKIVGNDSHNFELTRCIDI